MEFKDLLKKKEADLQKMLAEERANLYELRLKSAVTPIRDNAQFKKSKRTIARIMTALNSQKEDQANN